jgi:molybdenum cofactor cytidylyltransferase
MISLADKPLVASGIIDSVIDAYAAAGRDICVPVHRGMRGHPVILSRELGAEIEALEGDRGAERVLAARRDRVAEVQVASDAVLVDVDAACDLEQLKARLAESGRH